MGVFRQWPGVSGISGWRFVQVPERFKVERKEFLHRSLMSTDDPKMTTVTSKGQITIPSQFRKQFGLDQGTKLMVVPTEQGLVLKKLDLPSVEEFQRRVEQRTGTVELSMEEIDELVHDARDET